MFGYLVVFVEFSLLLCGSKDNSINSQFKIKNKMKTKLLILIIFSIATSLFTACNPEKVNLKMLDNGETISKVYNGIGSSYGDTVLYQDHYNEDGFSYSGEKHNYRLVTLEDFKKNQKELKQWHHGIHKPSDEYPDWISKDVSVRRAVVVK